jgi:hypothetical protein
MALPTLESNLKLDFTIDSLARENGFGELAVFALLHAPPFELAPGIPRDRKYAVDTTLSWYQNPEEKTKREVGDMGLNAYSQSVMQLTGPTRFLAFTASEPKYGFADRQMHDFALSQLVKEQRPDVQFLNADEPVGPALRESVKGEQKLYSCVAHDFQDELPLLVGSAALWKLECKAFLQNTEGLDAPKGELLAVDVGKSEAKDDVMATGGESVSLEEFQKRLRNWTLPVIVKLSGGQSGSNFVLRTDEEREECIKSTGERLEQYRRPEHAPYTADKLGVLVQELKDVAESFCVNFVVPKEGDAFILGVAEQILGEHNSWAGARIEYTRQDALKQRFQAQITNLGSKMRDEGFVGVAGVDIVCASPEDKGLLVDINPRINGSLILPACQSHFQKLGYDWATIAWLPCPGPPSVLAQHIASLQNTRGLVLKAFSERVDGNTIGMIVMGAKSREDVMQVQMELFPKIQELEIARQTKLAAAAQQ